MGALAGAISDKVSLGFVAATEEQVCQHLEKHLQELPTNDAKSRAIVEEMLVDEARHQQTALDAGGSELSMPVKLGMSLMSKVMTKTTYFI
jgi:ubiquinone biosynthesis monooxygenase Coq7